MKRITAIELYNFLAFYGTDNKVRLPEGQNMLLYGENGSGKSSLCRALEVFFEAKETSDFDKQYRNLWADRAQSDTSIKVQVRDESIASPHIDTIQFPNKIILGWIKESRLASGFLTYRDILKTHFLEESRQNLFDLVVHEILRGYKIATSGKVLSEEWSEFEKIWDEFLLEDWGDPLSIRKDEFGDEKKVMDIIADLVADFGEISQQLDDSLELILKGLNPKINEFLTYFEQDVEVELVIGSHLDSFGNPEKGTMLSYHNLDDDIDLLKELRGRAVDPTVTTSVTKLLKNLTLKKPLLTAEVKYFGQLIPEHQTFLNEARLSALAICIFLAALRLKPDPPEGCKILFLDDVLIGLDSGNRLPLLRILQEHFQDFQVMISTYDRQWFEVSKRFVSKLNGQFQWKCFEQYVKDVPRGGSHFVNPVIYDSESNLARAKYHFKNPLSPDYPAAVNYLRKHLEETIRENMPPKELKEQSGEMQEGTRLLKPLLKRAKDFFERIHHSTATIDHIKEKLRTLLNPLSHYETDTPIYKREVIEIFQLSDQLLSEFQQIKASIIEVIPQDTWVQIRFIISVNETGVYRLKVRENVYLINRTVSNCTFHAISTHVVTNRAKSKEVSLPKSVFENYHSLENAYQNIFQFNKQDKFPLLTRHSDYLDAISIEDNGTLIPLKSKLPNP